MIRKLTLVAIFISAVSSAQYIESTPWMEELEKARTTTSKAVNQPHSLYEISDAFNRYWEGKDWKRKGSGFKPFMRWETYWKHQVDKNGYLPSSQALWNAWKNKQNSTAKVVNPTSNWTSLGPATHGVNSVSLPGQGRVNAIAVDPNNSNVWYVGAPAGGLWKSTNGGSSWTNLFDDFPQIGVSGIAIDPNNSNIIYIATGDDDAANTYSVGVFKSTNGGTTWQETGLNPSNSGVNSLMNEIVIDPTNSNVLWVATRAGLYKSIDAGDSWDNKRAGNIKDFKLKPGDSNTIYAVTASNFYKSTNGEDFNQITDNLPASSGRLVLGVSPDDANVVYVLSADTGANNFTYQGLYKSVDSGETFTASPNTTDLMESTQAWFDLALEVSPTNADELYVGCLNIWKSNNGGDSFIQLNAWNNGTPAYTHADIHTLKFFDNKLFCGSDGGIYVSENGGVSFTDYTINGISIAQIYRLSVASNDASKMVGGSQDNSGFVLNNNNWNVFTGGDGMDYEIDPSNNNMLYGFIQFGGFLFISSDSGQSVGGVEAPKDDMGNDIEGNWITPLAVSSQGDVFAGYDAVYKLTGSNWEKTSGDIGSGNIDDLEIDPTNPLVMYAAEGSIVYRSEDGGVNFTAFNVFDSEISDIAVNATDGSYIYVTTSNRVGIPQSQQQALRGVFKVTVNANGSAGPEENITFNLPADQAYYTIAHQGRHSDNPIYVGTSLGVYRLDDSLTEWEDYFTNLPSVVVSDLDISLDDEVITAATYGRGVWQSPIPIQVPNDDVRLLSISPETDAVLCGEIIPQVQVENNGLNTITEVDVLYNIDGGSNQNMTATVNLDSGEISTISLPALNITALGRSSINVTVSIANDAFADNNALTNDFFVNAFGFGDAINTFEAGSEDLVSYNENGTGSVWEKGVPTGTILNQAGSGTQVYGTNLDGNHPDGTKGILLSSCYELSNILAPVLKFNMAYDLEINFDIVYVQYTTDNGATWNVLGSIDSQPNWYNSDRTNANSGNADDCQNCPGAQWTGTNATLTEYAYDFEANAALGEPDLTNESNVVFRIVFHSDPAVTMEGAIIDDLVVEGFQDDNDDDNDGVLDINDNCPLIGNADQLNTDGDSEGNACDSDDDNDGIIDSEDNCPLVANADQADADLDGIGDVCDNDADNDGVPNAIDLCSGTPEGAVVDITGCEVFSLPSSNFRVQAKGESCIASNNGSIEITAAQILNYTAVLNGSAVNMTSDFTENISFTDLPAGSYEVCITVEGQSNYETCFNSVITEPEALSVTSKISSLDNEVVLNLSGGKAYTITLNGKKYETTENEITLPLDKVENTLSVKTGKDCQGVYEENIILSSELFIYPNPVAGGDMTVYLADLGPKEIELALFSINGTRVFNKKYTVQDNLVRFNVDALSKGIYLLNIKTGSSLLNFKIVRK